MCSSPRHPPSSVTERRLNHPSAPRLSRSKGPCAALDQRVPQREEGGSEQGMKISISSRLVRHQCRHHGCIALARFLCFQFQRLDRGTVVLSACRHTAVLRPPPRDEQTANMETTLQPLQMAKNTRGTKRAAGENKRGGEQSREWAARRVGQRAGSNGRTEAPLSILTLTLHLFCAHRALPVSL